MLQIFHWNHVLAKAISVEESALHMVVLDKLFWFIYVFFMFAKKRI